MSKKLIAGAGVVASLAVALAPLATFATGEPRTVVDNLNITINGSCEFGHDFTDGNITDIKGVTRTDGTAAWGANTSSEDTPKTGDGTFVNGTSTDTATATMEAGTKAASFATTIMRVYCNKDGGYRVKLTATNLEREASDAAAITPAGSSTIGAFDVAAATQSIYNITPTLVSGTSAAMENGFTSGSEATGLNTTANTPFFKNAAATDNAGDVVTVVYGVGLKKTQPAGTYTGSVTYTLTEGQS